MITQERIHTFIQSFDTGNTEFLNQIEQFALKTNVPVIRPQTQSFLKLLLAVKQPKEILEVGTAIGFSALLMSEYGPSDCRVTTIEKYEKRILIAKENFKKAGREDKIRLVEGDALEALKDLEGPYDFIFMDAAKGQYILQDGDILESRYAVTRRDRTIHGRMREYLYTIKHHDQLRTDILPIGDGITVSVRMK